jgi:hypothetical protein
VIPKGRGSGARRRRCRSASKTSARLDSVFSRSGASLAGGRPVARDGSVSVVNNPRMRCDRLVFGSSFAAGTSRTLPGMLVVGMRLGKSVTGCAWGWGVFLRPVSVERIASPSMDNRDCFFAVLPSMVGSLAGAAPAALRCDLGELAARPVGVETGRARADDEGIRARLWLCIRGRGPDLTPCRFTNNAAMQARNIQRKDQALLQHSGQQVARARP